jgi:hypothetical protein
VTTTDDRRHQRERRPGAGAVSATGKRNHGLGWLPWLLLGLLALLALLTFLLLRNVGDDGDRSGVDTTDDRGRPPRGRRPGRPATPNRRPHRPPVPGERPAAAPRPVLRVPRR